MQPLVVELLSSLILYQNGETTIQQISWGANKYDAEATRTEIKIKILTVTVEKLNLRSGSNYIKVKLLKSKL